jgi:hypothetical protein
MRDNRANRGSLNGTATAELPASEEYSKSAQVKFTVEKLTNIDTDGMRRLSLPQEVVAAIYLFHRLCEPEMASQ